MIGRLLTALLLVLALAVPAAAKPPMWRIKSGGAEVVLFGSVHLLTEGEDWRSPEIRAALARADQVWFEVPIDPGSRASGATAAVARGRLPAGQTLGALLPPEGRARLGRAAARLNLPMAQLDLLQPWFAEVWITVADLQAKGAQQSLGVDEQIALLAPASVDRRAFETAAEQVEMLASQPLADQARMLDTTLRELEEEPDGFVQLQKAWLAGDLAWIDQEALTPMRVEAPRLYETLVVARNRNWVEEITQLLKSGRHVFIVVGVGHLVGPDSVPLMLRRRGVTVEGP